MKKSHILYMSLVTVVLIFIIILAVSIHNRNKQPLERPGDDKKQTTQSVKKTPSEKLESDLEKYRGKETVSNAQTNPKKASEEGINLNADNKVLVQTDSNNAEEIKEAMVKWNSALGENVFLPAEKNGRTDLLIQDDETKLPVDIFRSTSLEEDLPQEYMTRVIPTQDHRIMILDNMNTRNSEEFENTMEDEILQALGKSIGINKDIEDTKTLLSSDEGRDELKSDFKSTKDKALYNKGLTSSDKETDKMNSINNKTYATWTNFRENIEKLPRFKDHNEELLSVIDTPNQVLYGQEAVNQGKNINKALQQSLKDMDKSGSYESNKGAYEDDEEMRDGQLTVADSYSKMGDDNDFINLTKDYSGDR